MQKKCRRCGDKFTVKKSEDYCPECEKVMTPPGAGVSKIITCECCGEDFTYTKEKPLGRWPKYCPTCASKLSKPYKEVRLKSLTLSKINNCRIILVMSSSTSHVPGIKATNWKT